MRTCPWEAGPLGPRLSSPGEREPHTAISGEPGEVNMLQFCSVSNSLSHEPFQIKWEVYFSKNCVARLHCLVVIIIASICILHESAYTTLPDQSYHPRSNRQIKCFIDTLKRTLKKARGTPTGKALQQFLQVYRIIPNDTTPSLPLAEVKCLHVKSGLCLTSYSTNKRNLSKKTLPIWRQSFFWMFHDNKSFWKMGTIEKNRRKYDLHN